MNIEKYRGLFLDEAREHVTALAMELGAEPPLASPAVDSLFRHAHSIKGMSASMGVLAVRDLSHAMEDLLGAVRSGQCALDRPLMSRLLAATDVLADQIECWARGETLASAAKGIQLLAGATPAATITELTPEFLVAQLVPVAELDLIPEPPEGARDSREMAAPVPAPAPASSAPAPAERATVRVATAFIDSLLERVTELALAHGSLRSGLAEHPGTPVRRGIDQLRRSIDRLREDTMAIRLTPFSSIVPDLGRAVRDAARATGKQVEFSVSGGEIALDRAVIEALADPLIHVLRNAIDHGLEPAARRAQMNKPAAGQVRVAIRREAESVYVTVRDDGRGLDGEALARKAVADGRLNAREAERMSPAEKRLLATLPGLSTAREVTSLSGRGVGLDLVRAKIEGLGGKLEIDSLPGAYTEITLRAPLTLALQRLFLVSSGGNRYALPVARIIGLYQIKAHELRHSAGGWEVDLDDLETQPFVPLAEVLGEAFDPGTGPLTGLLLEARGKRMVLGVEEALSEGELVVRPLGRPLQRLPVFSAAAILAEGELALVLDTDGIFPG